MSSKVFQYSINRCFCCGLR